MPGDGRGRGRPALLLRPARTCACGRVHLRPTGDASTGRVRVVDQRGRLEGELGRLQRVRGRPVCRSFGALVCGLTCKQFGREGRLVGRSNSGRDLNRCNCLQWEHLMFCYRATRTDCLRVRCKRRTGAINHCVCGAIIIGAFWRGAHSEPVTERSVRSVGRGRPARVLRVAQSVLRAGALWYSLARPTRPTRHYTRYGCGCGRRTKALDLDRTGSL